MFQQTNKIPAQIDQMDWFFNEREDLIVPQYQEVTDQYLAQDYMFQWQESSIDMSMFGELPLIDYGASNSENSLPGSGSNNWSYQLDSSSSETERMNDMLLESLFEESSNLVGKAHHFVGGPAHSNCSTSKPFNNLAKELKYIEVPSVPHSIGRNKDGTKPTFMLSSSEQREYFPATKAPSCEMDAFPEADEQVDEETSMEATALQELESAVIQLKQGTRMNFRDAFYRLANNSKQQHVRGQAQSGEFQEPSRSIEVERMESERNTFDSTVAHLMFNNLNCEVLNPSGVWVNAKEAIAIFQL